MLSIFHLSILATLLCVLIQQQQLARSAPALEFTSNENEPDYWQRRKEWFYRRTRFELPDGNLKLLGAKRLIGQNKSAQARGHLPFWFDYELFKKVFKRPTVNREEEFLRHNLYINTCVRTLRARVLYRMLAGTSDTFITNDADRFHYEIFGPMMQDTQTTTENGEIAITVSTRLANGTAEREDPLDRAIRLIRQDMEIVESRNQVETNLKAFNEVDGSAIRGRLPYGN